MTVVSTDNGSLEASVVICAYTLERWDDLQQAVTSVVAQQLPVKEIIVVVDHNTELLGRVHDLLTAPEPALVGPSRPRMVVIANQGARGLSGARNTGISVASSEIVAFLDDDAQADVGWSERLLAAYADPEVIACGGAAVAALAGTRPNWWPVEFDWVIGCSYVGLPDSTATVRNLLGANMSVRRRAVVELGGFSEGVGRVGACPVGFRRVWRQEGGECDETDLFIRLAQRWPQARVVYEPAARVHHTVPKARLSWRYFRSRCFAEGLAKGTIAARFGNGHALAPERSYALRVLPRGMATGILDACHGEKGAGLRAMAIGAGFVVTTVGYLSGATSHFAARTRPRPAVAT